MRFGCSNVFYNGTAAFNLEIASLGFPENSIGLQPAYLTNSFLPFFSIPKLMLPESCWSNTQKTLPIDWSHLKSCWSWSSKDTLSILNLIGCWFI